MVTFYTHDAKRYDCILHEFHIEEALKMLIAALPVQWFAKESMGHAENDSAVLQIILYIVEHLVFCEPIERTDIFFKAKSAEIKKNFPIEHPENLKNAITFAWNNLSNPNLFKRLDEVVYAKDPQKKVDFKFTTMQPVDAFCKIKDMFIKVVLINTIKSLITNWIDQVRLERLNQETKRAKDQAEQAVLELKFKQQEGEQQKKVILETFQVQQDTIENLRRQNEAVKNKLATLQEDSASSKQARLASENKAEEEKRRADIYRQELLRATNAIEQVKQQQNQPLSDQVGLTNEIKALNAKLPNDEKKLTVERYKELVALKQSQLDDLLNALKLDKNTHEIAQIEENKANIEKLKAEIADTEMEMDSYDKLVISLQRRSGTEQKVNQLKEDSALQKEILFTKKQDLQKLETENDKLTRAQQSLSLSKKLFEQELSELREKLTQAEEQLKQEKDEALKLQNEINQKKQELQDLVDKTGYFAPDVDAVLKDKPFVKEVEEAPVKAPNAVPSVNVPDHAGLYSNDDKKHWDVIKNFVNKYPKISIQEEQIKIVMDKIQNPQAVDQQKFHLACHLIKKTQLVGLLQYFLSKNTGIDAWRDRHGQTLLHYTIQIGTVSERVLATIISHLSNDTLLLLNNNKQPINVLLLSCAIPQQAKDNLMKILIERGVIAVETKVEEIICEPVEPLLPPLEIPQPMFTPKTTPPLPPRYTPGLFKESPPNPIHNPAPPPPLPPVPVLFVQQGMPPSQPASEYVQQGMPPQNGDSQNRGALLAGITEFNKSGLKKSKPNLNPDQNSNPSPNPNPMSGPAALMNAIGLAAQKRRPQLEESVDSDSDEDMNNSF